MKTVKALLLSMSLMLVGVPAAIANNEADLNSLLSLVSQGMARDAQENQKRLDDFIGERNTQAAKLDAAKRRRAELEALSARLESEFQKNEVKLTGLQQRLDERLGSLKEMFGVLQQVSGDVKGHFSGAPTSAQFSGREDFLGTLIEKAGSSSKLPSVDELERLWFEMQREMIESGRITRFEGEVITAAGERVRQPVTRIGNFALITDAQYLNWDPDKGEMLELARQPSGRYLSSVQDYAGHQGDGLEMLWIDPSGGSLLGLLIQSPSLSERIEQGGLVGYIIMAIGLLALAIAVWRMVDLSLISAKIRQQMQSDVPGANPLGRLMQAYTANRTVDQETLELKMAEAIQKETPGLNRFIPFLKIISVVAPLLGLLGTVTGMINTFEVMSLFGTGDPKLMAGGISQALVTTVQGLVVAIPVVLLHTMTNARYREIATLLQERAIGIIANHEEQRGVAVVAQGNTPKRGEIKRAVGAELGEASV